MAKVVSSLTFGVADNVTVSDVRHTLAQSADPTSLHKQLKSILKARAEAFYTLSHYGEHLSSFLLVRSFIFLIFLSLLIASRRVIWIDSPRWLANYWEAINYFPLKKFFYLTH